MNSWLRIILRPLPLLAVGLVLLLCTIYLGQAVTWVAGLSEWGSPRREVAWLALGLVSVGGAWLIAREARSYLRLRRVEKLKVALMGEGAISPQLERDLNRWLVTLEELHGEALAGALFATRAALPAQRTVAHLRETLEFHLFTVLDRRVENEIRRSALKLGLATSLVSMAFLDGFVVLYFSVALVRRVAELHGGRPGWIGTLQLLREVSLAALGADLSQHAADALTTRVGSLAAAAGQGLVSATLLVRVGLWAQAVCRPIEQERSSVGAFVARGAAQGLKKGVSGGVHRAIGMLRSSGGAVTGTKPPS